MAVNGAGVDCGMGAIGRGRLTTRGGGDESSAEWVREHWQHLGWRLNGWEALYDHDWTINITFLLDPTVSGLIGDVAISTTETLAQISYCRD